MEKCILVRLPGYDIEHWQTDFKTVLADFTEGEMWLQVYDKTEVGLVFSREAKIGRIGEITVDDYYQVYDKVI